MSKTIKISGITEIMAQRMKESWETSPRVTYSMSIELDAVDRFIQAFNEDHQKEAFKLTYNHVLMKACAMAARKHEHFRCSVAEDEIIIHDDINIGLAVATEKGLLVPNVKNADKRSLRQLCQETNRLIKEAREMSLDYQDIEGGTFTITNLGMYGIEHFTPIINQPEVAILGANKTCAKLVMENGSVVEKSYLPLDLVADHRIIDGAMAAGFLKEIKGLLETPETLIQE